MLILLPPSEGKTPAASGPPLDPSRLHFPLLSEPRSLVLKALAEASGSENALAVLGVGATLAPEVRRNTALDTEPCAPAHRVYTGVLYDALGYASLPPAVQRRADDAVLVMSALWGALGFADPIPAYRLSMSVRLPETGRLAAFWKQHLTGPLDEYAGDSLVVDCRSSTYAAAWAPDPQRTAAVNVFTVRDGQRKVVSHFAKHTRGELARHLLLRTGTEPATPQDLLAAAQEKWEAELVAPAGRKPYQLNLILAG
ncbi:MULTISPECIES: YaaA family protein [unclassified Arthrobacter]|uniref:YaaA family protein n=1 Tax=unclassified Arthrobacter TaxID=235627 RepID=UPI002101E8BF|nr:peroxide stress protein YaaA [Arthrobacter sp. zg-Y1171]MCQ1986544.1 peroxide stress protein YaaA [Arthrobacter sp. zg-Y844]MCQ1995206.1 peroxide stress protein YaaA [Arthrobacter sp. zg-Y1171]UWX80751.1 peroxide stress protein YaaA [Arthrobacter sp. zg-Y1171]